ncbi:MAG: hypothetical protein AB1705_14580 [Verrucomicrobiota bacterium]
MPNEIKDKFSSAAALTITLASLGSSSTAGRQSTLVDNSTTRYQKLLIYVKLTLGTSPTGNKAAYVYLIRGDGAATHRSDGAGASDAAWPASTVAINAQLIGTMVDRSSPATGDVIYGEFLVDNPGPEWGIGILHDTGVALNATAGNHHVRWVGLNPEVQ